MEKIKTPAQIFWGNFAKIIIENRIKIIVFELLIILGSAYWFLPKITQDVSFDSIFGRDSAVKKNRLMFEDLYGRDEITIIGIKSDHIFTLDFLTELKALHEALENCSVKIHDVTSLVNARLTEGKGDEIVVHDLLEDFPDNKSQLKDLRNLVLTNKAYKNTLINEAGDFTAIIVETEVISDIENIDLVLKIKNLVKDHKTDDFPVYVAGSPAIMQVLDSTLAKDFIKFIILTLVVVCLILAFLFRRISGILLPVLTIILTLLLTLTLKSILHSPVSTVTNILIPFIMAVGIADSVHILSVFFNKWTDDNTKEALIATVEHCAMPCLLTSLTTAAGLFSFLNKEIVTIRDLGFFGGVGTLIAFILTMTLMVAGLSFLKKNKTKKVRKPFLPFPEQTIPKLGLFGVRNHKYILGFISILLIFIMVSILKVQVSHNPLEWITKTDPVVSATKILDDNFSGSVGLELMINSNKEGLFKTPGFLHKLEELEKTAKEYKKDGTPFISSVTSLLTLIREANQAVNEGKEKFYSIPDNRNLIAQELLLLESGGGSEWLEDFVSFDYSSGRITFRAPWIDTNGYSEFLKLIKNETKTLFADAPPEIKPEQMILTGNIAIFSQAVSAMLPLSIRGFCIAFFIITLMLIILFKDVKLGLISMVPNLFPVLFTLALMGIFKINLDMFNLFVGSIALGIVVDDTIHVIHHFKDEMKLNNGDVEAAVEAALASSGRALLFTTIILCLGFSTYLLSNMGNIYSFGILLIITLTTALVADFILTPAVLALFYKNSQDLKSEGEILPDFNLE